MEEINNAIDSAIRGNTILESLTNVRITRPKKALRWERILERFLKKGNSTLEKNLSFKRRDKRTNLPPGSKYTLKGGKVYILIDTSGSISDDTLRRFGEEIYTLIKSLDMEYKIWAYTYGISEPINVRDLKHGKLEVNYRGGTDLITALKTLQEQKMSKPDIWIVLTDGYDDVPTSEDFMNQKVMFIFSEDHSTSSENTARQYGYEIAIIKNDI